MSKLSSAETTGRSGANEGGDAERVPSYGKRAAFASARAGWESFRGIGARLGAETRESDGNKYFILKGRKFDIIGDARGGGHANDESAE
jgi:hypothetical protein